MNSHPNRLTPLLAIVAGLIFAWIAIHEFNYASNHPYASALAEVLAWGAVAGVLLAVAVTAHWWDVDARLRAQEETVERERHRVHDDA
jgi:type VI protein secretion system component VasK